jgi:putative phosphoribosyl transferase
MLGARKAETIRHGADHDPMSQRPSPSGDRFDSLAELPADWTHGRAWFADRRDAGRQLAAVLDDFRYEDPVVVGIPPGGMAVAAEVARALGAPLDVVPLCALIAPEDRSRPFGILAERGVVVLDPDAVREMHLDGDEVDAKVQSARQELDHLLAEYHPTGRRLAVAGRTVLLVDDGLVSSRNVQAGARSLRERGATRIILAVPVARSGCAIEMREWVDQVVSLEDRRQPRALRLWYDDFGETTEDESAALLSEHVGAREREVKIEVPPETLLSGHLTVPWGAYARGAVLLAGFPRAKPGATRSGSLAAALNKAGLATLQLDLLRATEDRDTTSVFDVDMLAERLVGATRWLRAQPETARLALGYIGSDIGSAAALVPAARLRAGICAVVTCGGRPDWANRWLSGIVAPVLMISVEADARARARSRDAQCQLRCVSDLAVVRERTGTVDWPEAGEQMAALALEWLTQHLTEAAPIRERHRVALA